MKTTVKTFSFLLILFSLLLISCTKDEYANQRASGSDYSNGQGVSDLPVSDHPIDVNVKVVLSYDYEQGEFHFEADRPIPCDIKFKVYTKYGNTAVFSMRKGVNHVNYPFFPNDDQGPMDAYIITNIQHWKCNNDEKNEYTYGNITYHFCYGTPNLICEEES